MTVPAAPAASDADTLDTLQAALDVFNGPCSTAVPAGGRQQLRDLAEKHKQAAAKAALLASNAVAPAAPGQGDAPPCGDRAPLPEAELRGVVFALEQSTIALCSYCHGFTSDAGPSLSRSLKQLCGGVVEPTKQLASLLRKGDAAELRRAFGMVWGTCDELVRGPLDNKACLFRELADVMQGIKAATKELDELIEASRHELDQVAEVTEAAEPPAAATAAAAAAATAEVKSLSATPGGGTQALLESGSASAPGSGSECGFQRLESNQPTAAPATPPEDRAAPDDADGGTGDTVGKGDAGGRIAGREAGKKKVEKDEDGSEEEDDDDEDDAEEEGEEEDSDDFRDMGTLSAGELCTAEAAAALLTAAQGALRAISRPLLEGPAVTSSHCLDDWESLAWHAGKLRCSCEALVACLYPPHDDPEELEGEAEAVANTLELMLVEFPEAYLGGAEGPGPGAEVAAAGLVAQQLEAVQLQVDGATGRLRDALGRMARGTAGSGVGPAGAAETGGVHR